MTQAGEEHFSLKPKLGGYSGCSWGLLDYWSMKQVGGSRWDPLKGSKCAGAMCRLTKSMGGRLDRQELRKI